MLEKLGLPAKPAAKGATWVLDASHCQTCSGAFSLFNRKHHCRRCGGIFCGHCTQTRVVLRGQGDTPVRICEPCRKLEEASRFHSRYANRLKASKGVTKLYNGADADVLLKEALGDGAKSILSIDDDLVDCEINHAYRDQGSTTDAGQGAGDDLEVSTPAKKALAPTEEKSLSPEALRELSLEQKKLYTVLKRDGKSAEALAAYKRSKELSREAEALELSLKKNRRKLATAELVSEVQKSSKESPENVENKAQSMADEKQSATKLMKPKGGEDEELLNALKELGWTDGDLREKKSKVGPVSDLELLSEISESVSEEAGIRKRTAVVSSNKQSPTQMEILAHKRRALALKREGKTMEAKEELKKAKVLEKKLEEMQLLGGAEEDEEEEDDGDEVSALIRSLEKEEKLTTTRKSLSVAETHFDVTLPSFTEDEDDNPHVDVTDDDLHDPSMVAALRAMGWEEEAATMERFSAPETGGPEALHIASSLESESTLQSQILAHKRRALGLKREGKVTEAKDELQQAKVLEQKLECMRTASSHARQTSNQGLMRFDDLPEEPDDTVDVSEEDMLNPEFMAALKAMGLGEEEPEPLHTLVRPSRQEKKDLQEEILALKRSALTLKRAGQATEAREALRQGRALEQKLQKIQLELNVEAVTSVGSKSSGRQGGMTPLFSHAGLNGMDDNYDDNDPKVEVNADDFKDPELVAALKLVGWQEEDAYVQDKGPEPAEQTISPVNSPPQVMKVRNLSQKEQDTKSNLQKKLLGHKRIALALKRDGKVEEAKLELRLAKQVEKQLDEVESGTLVMNKVDMIVKPQQVTMHFGSDSEEETDVTEDDMENPDLLDALKAFGWKDEAAGERSQSASEDIQALPGPLVSSYQILQPSASTLKQASYGKVADRAQSLENFEGLAKGFSTNSSHKKSDSYHGSPDVQHIRKEPIAGQKSSGMKDHVFGLLDHPSAVILDPRKPLMEPGAFDLLTGGIWKPPTQMLLPEASFESQPGNVSTSRLPSQRLQTEVSNKIFEFESPFLAQEEMVFGNFVLEKGPSIEVVGNGLGEKSVQKSNPIAGSAGRVEVNKLSALENLEQSHNPQQPQSNTMDSVKEEILLHKRKALAFKRQGKQTEARDELKQAKLLEKQLESSGKELKEQKPPAAPLALEKVAAGQTLPKPGASTSLPQPTLAGEAVDGALSLRKGKVIPGASHKEQAHQQLRQGQDRMKLQQESLGHKRKAMTLRREGKTEEAEAEFELAKSLERQMEELDGGDRELSTSSSSQADVHMVEDVLDPQLLSALKGLGWKDQDIFVGGTTVDKSNSGSTSRSNNQATNSVGGRGVKPVNQPSESRIKNSPADPGLASKKAQEEKRLLEERIKQEKLKAVELKRSGRQVEALEALRGAKKLEKQLQSIVD